MPPPVAAVPMFDVPVTDEKIEYGLDSVVQDYFTNEMLGMAASGFVQKCDDTQPILFLGTLENSVTVSVLTGDLAGARKATISRKRFFSAKIAACVATDIGRGVYAKFSNEVSFSPGVNGNYVGTIWEIKDAQTVLVAPAPWIRQTSFGVFVLAPAGNQTLSFLHANKLIEAPITQNLTLTLPPGAGQSAGDFVRVIKTSAAVCSLTLQGSGSDNINGANTYVLNTAQYSVAKPEWDGGQWLVTEKI